MANKKKPSKGVKVGGRKTTRRATAVPMRARLDKPAQDLARLLDDPCGAPVVKGLASGSGGSIVVRLESDSIFFAGATETAGAYYWVPGALRAFQNAAANDNTGITLQQIAVPGAAFLNNYSSARAVAACIQIYWPGTELNRSGIVSMGVVPASQLTNVLPTAFGGGNGSITVGQIRAATQIVQRTPATMTEIKLRPGETEYRMVDIAALSADQAEFPEQAQGKNALVITAAGLPAGVGVRLRCVCVYELNPLSNQGIVASVETTRSMNSEKEVVQALDEAKPSWWHEAAFHGLGMAAVGGVAYATGDPQATMAALGAYQTVNAVRKASLRS